MITAFAPGKLYIAGEYAVVEPGHRAILVAVSQGITVEIKPMIASGQISSQQFGDLPLHWRRHDQIFIFDQSPKQFALVIAAMRTFERFAQEQGRSLQNYHLHIRSTLVDSANHKYGLGSSGAVIVAVLKALTQFYNLKLDLLALFKLAAISQQCVQKFGSGGDLAASIYGGWLIYQAYERPWLNQQMWANSISAIIEQPWPQLAIRSIAVPSYLRLLVGWTGIPASTPTLVAMVQAKKAQHAVFYQQFLAQAQQSIHVLIQGLTEHNIALVLQQIRHYRQLLQQLAQHTLTTIETAPLTRLIELAESFAAAAKSSGAGGGDCGIALTSSIATEQQVYAAWRQAGITPLPLTVFTESTFYESTA